MMRRTQGETQCFVYDGHNRLEEAWTEATVGFSGTCAAFPTLPTDQTSWDASAWAHSAGPYATQWAYSNSGTITSITNKIASGPTSSTSEVDAFLYPAAGTDGAHGVTGIDN